MRLILTPLAERDLESIGDHIANDSPRRALSFVKELRVQCTKVAASPQAYCQRPELGEAIRSCAYGNYVIFFVEDGGLVRIIRVLHGAMDIQIRFNEGKLSPEVLD
jgi:toxin ParE1/3/4